MSQPQVSVTTKANLTGISHNELRPFIHRLLYHKTNYRVALHSIGAYSQDAGSTINLVYGVGHSATAKALPQTSYSGAMAQAGAVVNIVGAQYHPSKFLNNIVILVGTLSRGDYRYFVTLVTSQFAGNQVQRFIPGCLSKLPISPHQGGG